jgi:hypothetical protein
MTLRGKIDDRVYASDDLADELRVSDISMDELVTRVPLDIPKVLQVSRIGELVEIDDQVFGLPCQDVTDEIGADESSPAGDE